MMFAFDAADEHFPSHHLEEAPAPAFAVPVTILDALRGGQMPTSEDGGLQSAAGDGEDAVNMKPSQSTPNMFGAYRPTSPPVEHPFCGSGTPPIDIVLTPSAFRSRSRAREEQAEKEATLPDSTLRPLPQVSKNARKKKRKPKQKVIAALSTVRGFTPVTSGDEDSDFSTGSFRTGRGLNVQHSCTVLRKDLSLDRSGTSSMGSSQEIRSSSPSPGISTLTRQLTTLNYDSSSGRPSLLRNRSKLGSGDTSSASATSGTSGDEGPPETTQYEVPLEHDFISQDVSLRENVDARQGSLFNGDVVRKMQATDFKPLRCLGKGTYGTVLLVKQAATGKLYAQKQFRKASLTVRKRLVEQTKTERSILKSINRHPFVVKLYYAFQDHEKLYLILEYAQGGELFERMRSERMFPEPTAAFYMAEMVLALEHLHHTVGVVYRDLKPENCMIDAEGHLLLTDFGLSKEAVDGEHRCRSMTGTVEYMAPEVIKMQEYGTAVDWWSFGVLGWDLLAGGSPFQSGNDRQIREKILKPLLNYPFFFTLDARDLLGRFLQRTPKKRLGANMPKDMKTIKNHRFFRKIDWKKLERRELEPPIIPFITDPELAENFSPEFTNLAVSPVVPGPLHSDGPKGDHDQFGGFSYVASGSLFEQSVFSAAA